MGNFRAFARIFLALMGALSIGLLFAAVQGIQEASPQARVGGLALFSALSLVLVVVAFVIMILFDCSARRSVLSAISAFNRS